MAEFQSTVGQCHYERFWAELWERPDFAETLGRWCKLVETGGSNELWRAAE